MSKTMASPSEPDRAMPARDRWHLRVGTVVGAARWAAHPTERREYEQRFSLAVQGTSQEGRAHRIAMRYFALTERCMRLEDRPAAREAIRVSGVDALPPRRLYAFVHSPSLWLLLHGMTRAGAPFSPVVADWFWDDPHRDLRVGAVERAGGEIIPAGGSFDRIVAAATEGRHPALAVDVPGRTPLRFLGKPAALRSGLASLALAVDVPIVPVLGRWNGMVPEVVLGAPIAPQGTPAELLARVVAAVEAPLLAAPEYWMPYTSELWPGARAEHRAAFGESAPTAGVASVS